MNAHYTSPTVIRAIYEAVEKMGFRAGNILEPSMGVGNFFGMLPESMAGSRLYGVELDSISGRIAKQLYPKADITVAGFETTDRRDFYDLAIGNVPFGQYQVNDKAYNKLGFNIHNYFFAKALDQVRPGGVVAFVTSRYTMDAKDSTVRRYLAQRAELLGAIRLPNDAFKRMPELRSFQTFSFCKNGTVRWTSPLTGRRPAGPRKASRSTSIFSTTRRWCWGGPPPKAPNTASRITPWSPSRGWSWPTSCTMP